MVFDPPGPGASPKVRLVVDAASNAEPGSDRGLGRYTVALCEAVSTLEGYNVVLYGGRVRARHRLSEWMDIPARATFIRRHGGFFHATTAYHLEPMSVRRTVVSIQDVVPLDLPAYRKTGLKARYFFRLAQRCGAFIASSTFTAQRVAYHLHCPAGDISVAPLPIGPVTATCPGPPGCPGLPPDLGEYVVSLADLRTYDPRKRFPWLVGAGPYLLREGLGLIVVGAGSEHIATAGVRGLGRLCDLHMRRLFGGAHCFLYPTAYEGQGLPPQEALWEGTPVVAFRNSSLPEMLGPGAVWLEEPRDSWNTLNSVGPDDPAAEALATAAVQLARDTLHRHCLGTAGKHHVKQFTFERFRSQVQVAYDRLTYQRRPTMR